MNNLTTYLYAVIMSVALVFSFKVKASISDYQVYSDSTGHIYLEAPKRFVLIASEVNIPLFVTQKYGYLKIVRSSNTWLLEPLTPAQWAALSLSPGHSSVRAAQVYGDGSVLLLMVNQNIPALLVGGFDSSPTITSANTDGSVYLGKKVTYLHTDVLGSVIAETDESGTVKKTTDYKPFGESKNN